MTLSKSQYIRATQCPKILWMDKFMPDKAADTNLDAIFETGNEVGDLARSYFGSYSLVDFSFDSIFHKEAVPQYWYGLAFY